MWQSLQRARFVGVFGRAAALHDGMWYVARGAWPTIQDVFGDEDDLVGTVVPNADPQNRGIAPDPGATHTRIDANGAKAGGISLTRKEYGQAIHGFTHEERRMKESLNEITTYAKSPTRHAGPATSTRRTVRRCMPTWGFAAVWLGLGSVVLAARGAAQGPAAAQPQPGERVRITEVGAYQPLLLRGPRQVVGTLAAWSDSQVAVRRGDSSRVLIPTRGITAVEVSRGWLTPPEGGIYGAKRGAIWSLAAAPLALLISRTSVNSAGAAWLAAASVGTGAALGLVYHGVLRVPERWQRTAGFPPNH